MKIAPLKISLFVIITLSILMIITSLLCYKNFIGLLSLWSRANKMNIYLKVDSTDKDKTDVLNLIQQTPQVSSAVVLDRQKAGLEFQNSLKNFSSGLITEDEMIDLIPETIEVDLQSSLTLTERETIFTELAKKMSANAQVDEISYSASWLKKLEFIDRILRSIGASVFLVLVTSISYLVALMMRSYVEDSKQEIEVYSLLGATRWSVYRIFLKDVFLFISTSLIIAFSSVLLIFTLLKNKLNTSGLFGMISDSLHFLSLTESISIVVLLFLFIFINSFFTIQASVNKLNQLSYD
ncbi:MAG: FtsX-like permease family protein [Bdellovibrionota bacterium]